MFDPILLVVPGQLEALATDWSPRPSVVPLA
jgi:hypothetical protein